MTLTYELTCNGHPDQLQNVPQPKSNYLVALLAEAVLMYLVSSGNVKVEGAIRELLLDHSSHV